MALKIVLSEKGEPVKLERSSFIITGGTRGIGRGLAEALLSRGACVAISGRNQTRLKSALKARTPRYRRSSRPTALLVSSAS